MLGEFCITPSAMGVFAHSAAPAPHRKRYRGREANPNTLAAFDAVASGLTIAAASRIHRVKQKTLDTYIYRRGGVNLVRFMRLSDKMDQQNG